MKKMVTLSFVLLMALVLAGPLVAGDEAVTLEGNLLCAKCTLHQEGLEKCQNVLVVTKDGAEVHYYIAKNEIANEYGDVCMKTNAVLVTGNVAEKDGQMWIEPSKIVAVEEAG